jgi:polyhydroxyalkanoate synthesis regulator phasin
MAEKQEKPMGTFPQVVGDWNWKKLAQDFLNFARNQFMASFEAMTLVQNQTHKMLTTFVSQNLAAQEESRKMLDEWMENLKKELDKVRSLWENNFKRAQDLFSKE